MNKRFLAFLLVLAGIVALGLVFWFIILPTLRGPGTTVQPTPTTPTPTTGQTPSVTTPVPTPTPDPGSPEERERQAQEALKRFAMDAAGRANSYSNVDGFASLQQAELDANAVWAAELRAERARLLEEQPRTIRSWGATTKPLSARIMNGTPVLSSALAVVLVQAQKTQTESGKDDVVSFIELRLTLEKVGGAWKVGAISEAALEL